MTYSFSIDDPLLYITSMSCPHTTCLSFSDNNTNFLFHTRNSPTTEIQDTAFTRPYWNINTHFLCTLLFCTCNTRLLSLLWFLCFGCCCSISDDLSCSFKSQLHILEILFKLNCEASLGCLLQTTLTSESIAMSICKIDVKVIWKIRGTFEVQRPENMTFLERVVSILQHIRVHIVRTVYMQ